MLQLLKKLLPTFSDPLVDVARSGDPKLFADTFRDTEVYVVSLPAALDRPAASADQASEEATMLAAIEHAAEAMAADESFEPFVLDVDGEAYLPVFTTPRAAETFAEHLARQADRVMPIQHAALDGRHLVPFVRDGIGLVINPTTDTEFVVPESMTTGFTS